MLWFMPEGDTLHLIARRMQPLVGQALRAVALPRSTQPTGHLVGKRLEAVEARGKNLLVTFEGAWVLHTHLRMNGAWRVRARASGEPARLPAGSVVYLATDTHEALCTNAPSVTLARRGSLRLDPLRSLGPDLLADPVDLGALAKRLRGAAEIALGVAVMDQRLVSGIGNVWKSEGLFACGLDPFAPVARFTDEELRALLAHVRSAMVANVDGTAHRRALVPARSGRRVTRFEPGGSRMGPAVYERARQPCRRCSTPIERTMQGTRSTYACPRCQPRRA
jgi:endonuclease-8